jgi:hypothetical protein
MLIHQRRWPAMEWKERRMVFLGFEYRFTGPVQFTDRLEVLSTANP